MLKGTQFLRFKKREVYSGSYTLKMTVLTIENKTLDRKRRGTKGIRKGTAIVV